MATKFENKNKNLYLWSKYVHKSHFSVRKSLKYNTFTVNYALFIAKCIFVYRLKYDFRPYNLGEF